MERPRPSTIAWGVLGAGVVAYEAFCPRGELMSERVDDALIEHRALTYAAIGVTALHLANVFEKLRLEELDPYHQVGKLGRFIKPDTERA